MDPRAPTTVMLVEDDEGVLLLLTEVLEGCGHRVRPFFNPLDALAECRHARPDLIILDWYLPFLSGRDFLRHLEMSGGGAPVVVLTGDVNLKKSPGITEVLIKPVGLDVLIERVASLCRAAHVPTLSAACT